MTHIQISAEKVSIPIDSIAIKISLSVWYKVTVLSVLNWLNNGKMKKMMDIWKPQMEELVSNANKMNSINQQLTQHQTIPSTSALSPAAKGHEEEN